MPSPTTDRVLTRRALNRALLARQSLLTRETLSPRAMAERLVGLQAQSPQDPYVALWSRLEDFNPDTLSRQLASRKMVRLALMRSTIHLVTDRDCLALRSVMQPAIERSLRGTFGKRLAGVNLATLAAAGRALVDKEPRLLGDIGRELATRWPERDQMALSHAVRALVPLVQPPPRGLWRQSGLAIHAAAESWLGKPLAEPSVDETVVRYLMAFGPATVADAQVWSGLSKLAEVFTRLRPRLRTYRDERGRELFDVADAPLPEVDTPAPPRFLPEYDNILLSHHDRSRVVSEQARIAITSDHRSRRWLLIDGDLAGTWTLETTRHAAALSIRAAVSLRPQQRREIVHEGERLAAFLAPDVAAHRVIVETAG